MQTSMFTALIAAYRANRNRLKNQKRRKVSNPRRYACPPGLRSQHHDVVCHRRLPRRRDLLGLQRNGPGHLQKRYRANVQGQVRLALYFCTIVSNLALYIRVFARVGPVHPEFLLGLALYLQGWPCTSKVGPVPPAPLCSGWPCTSRILCG